MELSERKKQILKAVVEHYIESAEPVGSKLLAQELGVSSATIRNELAELCELGFLEQPHTSAGRAPTPQGYRLYVNELMERRTVSAQEAERIDETLRDKLTNAGGAMANAGQLVSSIVNYPAYSVKRGNAALTVERFELLGVDERSFITVVMTSDKNVRSQLQQTALPFDAQRLGNLKHLLNTHFTGKSRAEMSTRLMSVSEQLAPELFLVVSKTVEYAAQVLDEAGRRDVETTGASRILTMPEYRDMDRAHELMTFLVDNKEQLPVPEGDAPLQVLIGPENVDAALRDTSVVVASYDIGEGMRGLVGVVGPTRMDYATVTARLAYFAESLSKMFGKGLPGKQENDNPEA
ncbi:MAG: heat-inducible transcriptional repressor HrcA [Oscillospiraceae bacterium]|nr:heat-inducible transcriptional repressor HrcA [Oscillospiraceae bacterium]